jgi:hypothetical protein
VNLRDELQGIYDQHGKLTPALVVDEARHESHPLHGRFEWDDAIAGEAWRREQAHQLIQSVRITYKSAGPDGQEKNIRAFHAVRGEDEDNNGYVYRPADEVVADPLATKILLADMEREWRTLRRRYQDFKEFWQMVSASLGDTAA